MLDLMLPPVVSGGADLSEHFLMCGCSTPTLPRIKPPASNQATEDMRMRREGNMNNELLRSSNLLLSHLYLHVLEE